MQFPHRNRSGNGMCDGCAACHRCSVLLSDGPAIFRVAFPPLPPGLTGAARFSPCVRGVARTGFSRKNSLLGLRMSPIARRCALSFSATISGMDFILLNARLASPRSRHKFPAGQVNRRDCAMSKWNSSARRHLEPRAIRGRILHRSAGIFRTRLRGGLDLERGACVSFAVDS